MNSKAARRYSIALYDAASEKGQLDSLTNDFVKILEMINMNKDLELFFQSPIVSRAKKSVAVKEIFSGKVSDLALTFLNLLISRGRDSLTKNILEDFISLRKEKEGIVDVTVKTAVGLNDEEKRKMKEKIDSYTMKQSKMNFEIDKDIIGGFVAKINDTVLDASLKSQLEKLKVKFREGDFVLN